MKSVIKNILESPTERKEDVELYEIALEEFESGNKLKGVWAKALSLSEGDENKAKSKYLKLRVDLLKDEKEIIDDEESEERIFEYESKNKEKLNESLDRAIKTVGNIMGFYLVVGILALLFFTAVTLISGFDEDMIFVLIYGIILVIPFLITKYGFKKPNKTLKDGKKKIVIVYLYTIFISLFCYILGWIFTAILLYHLIRLNKDFKYFK